MSRFKITAVEDAPAPARPVLDAINAQMGFVPNTFKAIAANPNVLEAVVSLQRTLTILDAKTRNSIARAVSQANWSTGAARSATPNSPPSATPGTATHRSSPSSR